MSNNISKTHGPVPRTILKKLDLTALILISLISLLTGCKTRNKASVIYPLCGLPYEECSPQMSTYKSVQLRRNGQDPNLALAVAASGGGHRAGNFTAGVMLGLEEIANHDSTRCDILSQVDYFSSVSGGGFAVAAYISSLHDHLYFNGAYDDYSFAAALRYPPQNYPPVNCKSDCKSTELPPDDQLTDPCLRRTLQGFYSSFLKNFSQEILFGLTLGKLGKPCQFEQAIDNDILGYCWRKSKLALTRPEETPDATLTLNDIFVRKDDADTQINLPYWITNATAYENGAIFAFTPDFLKLYDITGYRHRSKKYKYDREKDDYDDFIWNFPLSLGVTASGNFPVLVPATTFESAMDPKNPYLHLLDGGTADNLGVITALRMLEKECDKAVTKKVLIVVDAYRGNFAPFSKIEYSPLIANTALRATNISLDSWRGRHHQIVRRLCNNNNVEVVFLSFDDLDRLPNCTALFDFGLSPDDVKKLTKNPSQAKPFILLRKIPTVNFKEKGKLSIPQQNLLLAAGRYTVHKNKNEILQKLSW
ncbi:MAG: patatin-like phospholipase family protein [Planctomycetota bacterium]